MALDLRDKLEDSVPRDLPPRAVESKPVLANCFAGLCDSRLDGGDRIELAYVAGIKPILGDFVEGHGTGLYAVALDRRQPGRQIAKRATEILVLDPFGAVPEE